jgi:galacturonosyltransferase
MSNVLLETAATGRPIIATDIPGCRETFDPGVSGIPFKPKDTADLIRAVEEFLSLPYERRAEMGRAGRTKVEKCFDRNIVVNEYIKAIENEVK